MLDRLLKFLSDPNNRPSWTTSTLAQMAIMSVSIFLILAAKVAWVTGNLDGLKWAATVFGAGYLSARSTTPPPTPPASGAAA